MLKGFFAVLFIYQLAQADCIGTLGSTTHSGLIESHERDVLYFHQLAKDFISLEKNAPLFSSAGFEGPRGYINHTSALFLRDYEPLQLRNQHGRLVMLTYISTKSPGPIPFSGSMNTYVPVRGPSDIPNAKLYKIRDQNIWMESRHLPLLAEGGNFFQVAGRVFISEKMISDNAKPESELLTYLTGGSKASDTASLASNIVRSIVKAGYKKRNRDEVLLEVAKAFGVDSKNIVVLPWMPGESTGHLDMYFSDLPDGRVAIPRIPESVIQSLGYDHEKQFARGTNTFLDDQASSLEKKGVGVVRIPMLAPRNLVKSAVSPFGWDAQFPSTVNWIISGSTVYIPQFKGILESLASHVRQQFEIQLDSTVKALGLTPIYIEASELLSTNGLLHCISSQYTAH